MKMKSLLWGLVVALSCAGAAHARDNLMKQAQGLFRPIPAKAPQLKDNPATPAKIDLGMKLYFDPRLSASQLISCNTCHNVGLGSADLQETSIGHGWQKGPRNAPPVFNAVFNIAQFWDGRAEDLKAQAKGPVQAGVEMNNKPERVIETLTSIPGYRPLFEKAFPQARQPISFDNMAKAIEVFEATLITPDAPFDRYLKGNRRALTAQQEAGLKLFIGKGCASCHAGVNLGGAGYYPFGVKAAPSAEVRPEGDTGRFKVTNTKSDRYVFRAPALRNVALTQPYFHSGKVWKLADAVRIMGSSQLGITLTGTESEQVHAFLLSLTGVQPKLAYPVLPPSADNTPHPMLR